MVEFNHHQCNRFCAALSIAAGLGLVRLPTAEADWNAAQTRYTQAVTRIVELTAADASSWIDPDEEPTIHSLTTSADGTVVAFKAQETIGSDKGLYVVNADGSGLTDLTPLIPEEMENDFHELHLNEDGSRLFFYTNLGDGISVYYIDLAGESLHEAVSGIELAGSHKNYVINAAGTRVFFRHAAGSEIHERGLFYADIGQPFVQAMSLDQVTEYNDLALIDLIDVSADGSRMMFVYGGWGTGGAGQTLTESLWFCAPGGTPERFPDEEHKYVWDYQSDFLTERYISADGQEALIAFKDRTDDGTVHTTQHIDRLTGDIRDLGAVSYSPISLSPTGSHALLHGDNRRMTRVNLVSEEMIDTYYYGGEIKPTTWMPKVSSLNTTATRYFVAGNEDYAHWVFRVDIADTDIGLAPQIDTLLFDGNALYVDDEGENGIRMRADVHDPTGAGLDWVRAVYIFDGLTRPEWHSEVPYSAELFDDGEHGDADAGDGTYGYEEFGPPRDSYFDEHSLPATVGVRFIARSQSGHYSFADTTLILTDDPDDVDADDEPDDGDGDQQADDADDGGVGDDDEGDGDDDSSGDDADSEPGDAGDHPAGDEPADTDDDGSPPPSNQQFAPGGGFEGFGAACPAATLSLTLIAVLGLLVTRRR